MIKLRLLTLLATATLSLSAVSGLSAATTIIRGPYLPSASPTSMVVRWRTDNTDVSIVRYGLSRSELTSTAKAEGIKPDIPLADLTVNKADSAPVLISSEADLPNHLANENAKAATDINNDGSAADGQLATSDYALAQALNVLKGMALRQRTPARS